MRGAEDGDGSSELQYETASTREDMLRMTRSKKYHCLYISSDDSWYPSANQRLDLVYVVPRKFPFCFMIDAMDFEANFEESKLHAVLKKLNTLKRIQMVRSLIPKKIIFSNMQNLKGVPCGSGTVQLGLYHPLTGRKIAATPAVDFQLVDIRGIQVASIDLKTCHGRKEISQQGLNLQFSCNLFQIDISFADFAKTQNFVIFFKDIYSLSPTDLFYSTIKLNSQLTLKLYFITYAKPGSKILSEQIMQSYPPFELVKLQLEVGSQNGLQPLSITAKGSFLSSVHRAKRSNTIDNLRYNICLAAKPQALRAYDFFSDKVARLCNLQLGLPISSQTNQLRIPPKVIRSHEYFSSSASPGQNRPNARNTVPRPRLAGGALSRSTIPPPGGSLSPQKSAFAAARRDAWVAEAWKPASRQEKSRLAKFWESGLQENHRHTRAVPSQTHHRRQNPQASPFVEACGDDGGNNPLLAPTDFQRDWMRSRPGREIDRPQANEASRHSRHRTATPPPASDDCHPDESGSMRSEGGSPYFL